MQGILIKTPKHADIAAVFGLFQALAHDGF
jgi:hypothetical protein